MENEAPMILKDHMGQIGWGIFSLSFLSYFYMQRLEKNTVAVFKHKDEKEKKFDRDINDLDRTPIEKQ